MTSTCTTCTCDPDLRCAEIDCHGCECRPGSCPGPCAPDTTWTPTMASPPAATPPAVPAGPGGRPLLIRACTRCGRQTVTERAHRRNPELAARYVAYHSQGYCRGCRKRARAEAARLP